MMTERNSKEVEDCRAFEKWAHWLLLKEYGNDTVSEEKDPLLYLYLLKAKKLEERYAKGYSSSVLESMYERDLLEELAEEQELKHSRLQSFTDDSSGQETRKALLKRLSFPFDQVSEGIFLGYIMEILLKQKKDTYVALLKRDVPYEIQMIRNLNVLLNILRDEYNLEIDDLDITADSLITDIDTVNDLFSILFQKFVLETDRIHWKSHIGEDALSAWCTDCISIYPGGQSERIDFDEGFYSGIPFCYILHSYSPEHIDLSSVSKHDPQMNLKQAFEISFSQYNISHIIQNFNINRTTILLYLSMLFTEIAHLSPSTFETREVAAGIRRKVFYMNLQQDYYDVAVSISDTLKQFEAFLRIERSRVSSVNDVDRFMSKFRAYRKEKQLVSRKLIRLYEINHNLSVLTRCQNAFAPYEPPSYLSLPKLLDLFSALLDHEVGFNLFLISSSANIEVEQSVSKSFEIQYEVIQDQIQRLSTSLYELESVQHVTSLQELHDRHDMIISISITTAQMKGRIQVLKRIFESVKEKKLLGLDFHGLETALSNLGALVTQQQLKFETIMMRDIDTESLRVKYRLMADDFGLTVSHSIVLLSSDGLDSQFLSVVLPYVRESLTTMESQIKDLSEIEKQIDGLEGHDDDLPSSTDLERFLNDLKMLIIKRESLAVENDNNNGALVHNMLTSFMDSTVQLIQRLDALHVFEFNDSELTEIKQLSDEVEALNELKLKITRSFETRNYDSTMILHKDTVINHYNTIQDIMTQIQRIARDRSTASTKREEDTRNLLKICQSITETLTETLKVDSAVEDSLKDHIMRAQTQRFANFISYISRGVNAESVSISRTLDAYASYFSKCLKMWCSRLEKDNSFIASRQMSFIQRGLKDFILKQESNISKMSNVRQILSGASEISARFSDLIEFNFFSHASNDDGGLSVRWTSLLNSLRDRGKLLIQESNIDSITGLAHDACSIEKFKHQIETVSHQRDRIESLVKGKDSSIIAILTELANLQASISFLTSFSSIFSQDDLSSFQRSQVEMLKEYVTMHHSEIKAYLLDIWSKQEVLFKYQERAQSILQSLNSVRHCCIAGEEECGDVIDLESISRQVIELEKLSRGQHAMEFMKAEYTPSYLNNLLQHVSELKEQHTMLQSFKTRKNSVVTNYQDWIKDQCSFVHDWFSKVNQTSSDISEARSINDLFKAARMIEHRKQEAKFIDNVLSFLTSCPDYRDLYHQFMDQLSFLHSLLVRLRGIESDYREGFFHDQAIRFEVSRMTGLIQILNDNYVRKDATTDRAPISLLTSMLDDCNSLKEYASISAQVVLRDVQLNTSESTLLEQVISSREKNQNQFQMLHNTFNQEYLTISSELEAKIRTETEILSISSRYNQVALATYEQLESMRNEQQRMNSVRVESITKMIALLENIDQQLSGRAIQALPLTLVKLKVKRLVDGSGKEDEALDPSREQQLTAKILELVDSVSAWIDHGRKIETAFNKSVPAIAQTEKVLGVMLRLIQEEVDQYHNLTKAVGLSIELSLLVNNMEVDDALRTVEIKWIEWIQASRRFVRVIEDKIGELLINEERKRQIQDFSNGNLEDWLVKGMEQLNTSLTTKINTMPMLALAQERLRYLNQQKEIMSITFENMRNTFQQISHPDASLISYQQRMSNLWKMMALALVSNQDMLHQVAHVLHRSHEQQKQMIQAFAKFILLNSNARKLFCGNMRNNSSSQMKFTLASFESKMKSEILKLMEFIRQLGGDTFSELISNHWSSTLFMVDRFTKIMEDVKDEETVRTHRRQLFDSKISDYKGDLQLLASRVSMLRKESQTSSAAEDKIRQLESFNSQALKILSHYSALLDSFRDIRDIIDELSLEEEFIIVFNTIEATFTFALQEYDILKKYEVLSSTYSGLFQMIHTWMMSYEDLRNEKFTKETLDSICSSQWACSLYFTQRVQISLLSKQLVIAWSKLTSMGITLKSDLKTPSDIQKRIDRLDRSIKKKQARNSALLEQFECVLTIREQWLESAFSLSSWAKEECSALYSLMTNDEKVTSAQVDLKKIEKLRSSIASTEPKYQFLKSFRESITEQCVLLPSNWDEYLLDIIGRVQGDIELLTTITDATEMYYSYMGSSQDDYKKIQETYSVHFTKMNRRIEKLNSNLLLDSSKLQLEQYYEEYLSMASDMRTIIALYDFMQLIAYSKAAKTSIQVCLGAYQSLGTNLRNLGVREKFKYQDIEVVVPKTNHFDDFLTELFLNRWTTLALNDLRIMIERVQGNSSVDHFIEATILFIVFKQELATNQQLKNHLDDNNLLSDDTLNARWLELEDTVQEVAKSLTVRVNQCIQEAYNHGSAESICNKLSETLTSKRSLTSTEKDLLQTLVDKLNGSQREEFQHMLAHKPIQTNENRPQNQELFTKICVDYQSLFTYLSQKIIELLDSFSPDSTLVSNMELVHSKEIVPKLRHISQLFEEVTVDNLSKTLMSCLSQLADRFKCLLDEIHAEIDSTNLTNHSLSMLSSEYKEISDTLLMDLESVKSKLDQIDSRSSSRQSSSNASNIEEIELRSTIGRAYIAHTLENGGSPAQQYQHVKSLKDHVLAICQKFSSLSLLHLHGIQNLGDQMLSVKRTKTKISEIWQLCSQTLGSIEQAISTVLRKCLNSPIRSLESDHEEISSWYKESLSTIDDILGTNSFYDSQISLLDIKILTVQHEYYEERLVKYLQAEQRAEATMELSTLRKQLLNKILNLPSTDEVKEIVVAHQSYESHMQKQACDFEYVEALLDTLFTSANAVRDIFSGVQNDNHNIKALLQKRIELGICRTQIEMIRDQLEGVVGKTMDDLQIGGAQHEKREHASEVSFTKLTLDDISGKFSQLREFVTRLIQELQSMQSLYDSHSSTAKELIKSLNSLYFWHHKSLLILLPEKTRILDSIEIVQLLSDGLQTLRSEYNNTVKNEYARIVGHYKNSLNRERNDNVSSFIQDAIELYGLFSWNETEKMWLSIQDLLRKRQPQLDQEEADRRNLKKQYNVPKEMVDVVQSTFIHFARNNRTTDDASHVHYSKLNNVLYAIGMKKTMHRYYNGTHNGNNSNGSETSPIELVSKFLNNNSTTGPIDLDDPSSVLSFADLMRYISQAVTPVFSVNDMKKVLASISSRYAIKNWDDLKNVLATSLATHEIHTLYTLIRFTAQGIDMNKLAEDVFTS